MADNILDLTEPEHIIDVSVGEGRLVAALKPSHPALVWIGSKNKGDEFTIQLDPDAFEVSTRTGALDEVAPHEFSEDGTQVSFANVPPV